MTTDGLTYAALLAGAVLLDALVRPRALRSAVGMTLTGLTVSAAFGLFLTVCGSPPVAVALALATLALLAIASNAKHAMLGEPLVFSDLALIGAVFSHPQFYLSAVPVWLRATAAIVAAGLLAVLAWLFVPDLRAHLAGVALFGASLVALALTLRGCRRLARVPALHDDVRRHGLLPTLLLYWLRWRESRDPPPCPQRQSVSATGPELLVVIQCESFADPAELFGDPALALPGLAAAREQAFQWGRLQVSGFGAYTMRTEYGVLFGREEAALGFRRYDPFLTALGEASHALPRRLGPAWRSLFVHPHDMRFYGRDRIMPAAGFAALVGEERFAAPSPGEGRYVTDAAMTEQIVALAAAATGPSLIYAVTIENHGPWAADGTPSGNDLVSGYLRLARNSDAMLTDLRDRLGALGRPAMLVFFGDHRPSIPGATAPGSDRHTPYVMLRLDADGRVVPSANRRVDLTPAALHHAILEAAVGEAQSRPAP